jgi:hypothetical protein
VYRRTLHHILRLISRRALSFGAKAADAPSHHVREHRFLCDQM